jgi:hypothetical protein
MKFGGCDPRIQALSDLNELCVPFLLFIYITFELTLSFKLKIKSTRFWQDTTPSRKEIFQSPLILYPKNILISMIVLLLHQKRLVVAVICRGFFRMWLNQHRRRHSWWLFLSWSSSPRVPWEMLNFGKNEWITNFFASKVPCPWEGCNFRTVHQLSSCNVRCDFQTLQEYSTCIICYYNSSIDAFFYIPTQHPRKGIYMPGL